MNDTLRIFHARSVETFVKNVQQLEYFEQMVAEYAGKDSQKHGFFVGEADKLRSSIYQCAPWIKLSLEKCFPELLNSDPVPVAPVPEFVKDFNC